MVRRIAAPPDLLLESHFLNLIAHLHNHDALGWCLIDVAADRNIDGLAHTVGENNLSCAVVGRHDYDVATLAVDAS